LKITHYSNSFISIRSQNEHIVCDPWMGKANSGGWQSFPEYPIDLLARNLSDVRWIYLSHLHDDHFHPDTLKNLGLLDREFLIKKFKAPVMRERLKRLGVTRIHEIDPFTVNQLGPFELAIIPQMTSNSSELDDEVSYDLDTSIAIKADRAVFFNQVDNPLSTADLIKVRDWILSQLGKIDIACLMSGAASEYPHLFLGIDQESEKRRIVDQSLTKLMMWLQLLQPTFYFPAGGTYLIPGWLNVFRHNIAQPSYQDISYLIQQRNLTVQPLALEGGYSIELSSNEPPTWAEPEVVPIESSPEAATQMHSADPYDYEAVDAPPIERTIEMLHVASENWREKVEADGFHISQSIRFDVYSELMQMDGVPDKALKLASYQLFEPGDENVGELIIHIDQRALFGCLTRRFVWNGVLGSLCLYERRPNRHYPTDFFSINFLVLRNEQLNLWT
jgi:UDP-MurNAc hydroxylase